MRVPALTDIIQEANGNLTIPEIRVWCHPCQLNPLQDGDDYYHVFSSFEEALDYISRHPEAEQNPLVAFRGYELNLWEMQPEAEVLA